MHSPHNILVVVNVIIGGLLASGCPREQPATRAADAGPTAARFDAGVDAGVVAHEVAPPKGAPVLVVDAGTGAVDDQDAGQKQITVKGPASMVWKAIGGNHEGPGTVTVRASAPNIIALDSKAGSTHTVPIVDGVADFRALPNGKLVVHAPPGTQIFLGPKLLAATPLPKPLVLPYGDYTVRFVWKSKVRTQRARIAEETAVLRVRMDD